MTAFSAAVDVIFADPNVAADAQWFFAGIAPPVAIRVVRRAPDDVQDYGQARLSQPATTVDVRVSDIASPKPVDRIMIGGETFVIQGQPQRDRLGLVWTINLRPA
jgi:hypothetical protein